MQQPSQPQPDDGEAHAEPPEVVNTVRIQSVTCGRCGWPNACKVQDGMRVLQFMCQWCYQVTIGIVDPTIKRTIIF